MKKFKLNIKQLFSKVKNSPILINIITVGIITLIVKGFGFYKEIIVAGSFGLSELLDTFFIASLVPGFISEVFLNSFNSVFVPNYISEKKASKNIGAFQSTSLLVTIMSSAFFIFVAYLFTDVYLEIFFAGHTEQYYDLIKLQFYYLLPCILFWGLTSLMSGLLNIYGEFKYSSIYPVLTSIIIVICLIFFKDLLEETVLAVGMLLGSIVQFLFLLCIALQKKIIQLAKPDFSNINVVIMLKQVPSKISSGLLSGVNPLVDQFFSAQLIIGSITALNYGIKITSFIIGIIGIAIGNVILPYFSNNFIDNKKETFLKLKSILKGLLLGSIVFVLFIIIFSTPVITLLFERGAFTETDTYKVSKIQQMYALQIPSYVLGLVMVKFLTSINKNSFMVFTSFLSLILNIAINFILIKKM
uniref:murein biosynthesis integral membrane protein MurJ n=1 Tax=Gelidibacter sp. TaxID=2018083 RepID=UPI00404A5835